MSGAVLNIAFYRFQEVKNLAEEKDVLKQTSMKLGLRGTILLSLEGINGMMSGEEAQVREFQTFMESSEQWKGLTYKESYSDSLSHTRMLVKIKKEIIPVGDDSIQPAKFTAPTVSPSELKKWLDEKRDLTLLDTRNVYEIEVGAFENAQHLDLHHFRNFAEKIRTLPESARKKPLVMYCTGGIRCEKAGAVALRSGFEEVYQLEGGILNYFKECGQAHYEGHCFVFDKRVALDSSLQPHPEVIEGEVVAGRRKAL